MLLKCLKSTRNPAANLLGMLLDLGIALQLFRIVVVVNYIYSIYNLGGAAIGRVMPSFCNDFAYANSSSDGRSANGMASQYSHISCTLRDKGSVGKRARPGDKKCVIGLRLRTKNKK